MKIGHGDVLPLPLEGAFTQPTEEKIYITPKC
jgi:hypothetical protein